MQKQLAKILCDGIYYIIYDNSSKANPFVVKVKANGHLRKLSAYANYGSAMEHVMLAMRESGLYWDERLY